MSALRTIAARLFGRMQAEVSGAPPAEFTFVPTTVEDTAAVTAFACEHGLSVLPWGGGIHRVGPRWQPDVVVGTAGLGGIDWRPDDLTVVVGAGVRVADLEARLAERGQSAILPEHPGGATVGGAVAAAASSWRRLRYGALRDRMLEVLAVTGDGRVIRGGGQVVKNVSGYDLPRLYTGSFGSLGIIARVCLKLWPIGAAAATVRVDDPARALALAHRPLAILETRRTSKVYLAGTEAEVTAQAQALGGTASPGLDWPEEPRGAVEVSLRVPPAAVGAAVARMEGEYVAAHGVGEVAVAGDLAAATVSGWRSWAESQGGTVVVRRAPEDLALDPWGTAPSTLALQQRVKAAFDPYRVMVPGRLPGGL